METHRPRLRRRHAMFEVFVAPQHPSEYPQPLSSESPGGSLPRLSQEPDDTPIEIESSLATGELETSQTCPPYHRRGCDGDSHRVFLPELVHEFVADLRSELLDDMLCGRHSNALKAEIRAFCLVCRDWNLIFTPLLYRVIAFGMYDKKEMALLYGTLSRVQPARRDLVHIISLYFTPETPDENKWMVLLNQLPNLRELRISNLDISHLLPISSHCLKRLSKHCRVRLECRINDVEASLRCLTFFRTTQPEKGELLSDYQSNGSIHAMKLEIGHCEVVQARIQNVPERKMNSYLATLGPLLISIHPTYSSSMAQGEPAGKQSHFLRISLFYREM